MSTTNIHIYRLRTTWTGDRGAGTATLKPYTRDHQITIPGKHPIEGSSDASFLGDPTRWNPEELLLASVSACHKLWYLSLCAQAAIDVLAYVDDADGIMEEDADGAGQFKQITLTPRITLAAGSDKELAIALHHKAHEKYFIARSVNFPVHVKPVVISLPRISCYGEEPYKL